jgi:hypothetical protein
MNDGLIICSHREASQCEGGILIDGLRSRFNRPCFSKKKKDSFGGLPAGLARTAAPPASILCIFTHDRPSQRSSILPTFTKECNYGIRAGQTCSSLTKYKVTCSSLTKYKVNTIYFRLGQT